MDKAVVTMASGHYLLGAVVQAMELKETGCDWPHLLFTCPGESLGPYAGLLTYLGTEVREITGYLGHPWTAKTNAVVQAGAEHVLFMDADNLLLMDADELVEDSGYQETGAMFWRDFETMEADHVLYDLCGVAPRREQAQEAGQLLINVPRCLTALQEMDRLNRRWESIYPHTRGDKDMWRMAWLRTGQPWTWASPDINIYLDDTGHGRAIVQSYQSKERPAFHHRVHAKFSLDDNWWRPGIPNSLRWFNHIETVRKFLLK